MSRQKVSKKKLDVPSNSSNDTMSLERTSGHPTSSDTAPGPDGSPGQLKSHAEELHQRQSERCSEAASPSTLSFLLSPVL